MGKRFLTVLGVHLDSNVEWWLLIDTLLRQTVQRESRDRTTVDPTKSSNHQAINKLKESSSKSKVLALAEPGRRLLLRNPLTRIVVCAACVLALFCFVYQVTFRPVKCQSRTVQAVGQKNMIILVILIYLATHKPNYFRAQNHQSARRTANNCRSNLPLNPTPIPSIEQNGG